MIGRKPVKGDTLLCQAKLHESGTGKVLLSPGKKYTCTKASAKTKFFVMDNVGDEVEMPMDLFSKYFTFTDEGAEVKEKV